jgi:glycine betaine/proline transport system permease protein
MEQWLVDHKLPLGQWVKQVIDVLQNHSRLFDTISDAISFLVDGLTAIIMLVPPVIFILAAAVLTYLLHRSIWLSLFLVAALLLILNLGYWQATVETISLIGYSALVSVAIGIPIGIMAAHRPWLYAGLRPVLDMMQTLPTFVYLIPTIVLFGIGAAPGLISTVIFAIPAPIRLTYLGIASVPPQLKEAGQAFGATRGQLLRKVEIPFALPTIMAGVTQCIMLCLSMVVIAALVGADGLGKPVVRALGNVNIPMGFESGLAIVLVAIVLDRVCKWPERRLKGSR